jgi:hypothetical protein
MQRKIDVASRPRGMQRRRFLTAIPAVAGSFAAPALARQQAQAPSRVDPSALDCAEKIFGVDFTEAEEQAASAGVGRNLTSFEQLRELNIPLDTEPAITFHPYLPGKRPQGPATPGAKMKVTLTQPAARSSSIEDLAFLPITSLAPLLQRRDVSSTELTRMYLERRDSVGCEGSVRNERHSDDVGRWTVSEPGLRLRRGRRGTARGRGPSTRREAVDRCARTRRQLVPRTHE